MHMPPSAVSTNAKRPTTQACNPAPPKHAKHKMHQHRVGTSIRIPAPEPLLESGAVCVLCAYESAGWHMPGSELPGNATAIQDPMLRAGVMQ